MTKKSQLGLEDLLPQWHKSILNDIQRLGLPDPDHDYGFSSRLLKSHLSVDEWEKFNDWADGQTCMRDCKLGIINYTTDVIRGLDFIRHGRRTYWD